MRALYLVGLLVLFASRRLGSSAGVGQCEGHAQSVLDEAARQREAGEEPWRALLAGADGPCAARAIALAARWLREDTAEPWDEAVRAEEMELLASLLDALQAAPAEWRAAALKLRYALEQGGFRRAAQAVGKKMLTLDQCRHSACLSQREAAVLRLEQGEPAPPELRPLLAAAPDLKVGFRELPHSSPPRSVAELLQKGQAVKISGRSPVDPRFVDQCERADGHVPRQSLRAACPQLLQALVVPRFLTNDVLKRAARQGDDPFAAQPELLRLAKGEAPRLLVGAPLSAYAGIWVLRGALRVSLHRRERQALVHVIPPPPVAESRDRPWVGTALQPDLRARLGLTWGTSAEQPRKPQAADAVCGADGLVLLPSDGLLEVVAEEPTLAVVLYFVDHHAWPRHAEHREAHQLLEAYVEGRAPVVRTVNPQSYMSGDRLAPSWRDPRDQPFMVWARRK